VNLSTVIHLLAYFMYCTGRPQDVRNWPIIISLSFKVKAKNLWRIFLVWHIFIGIYRNTFDTKKKKNRTMFKSKSKNIGNFIVISSITDIRIIQNNIQTYNHLDVSLSEVFQTTMYKSLVYSCLGLQPGLMQIYLSRH